MFVNELGVERGVDPENLPARACVKAEMARPELLVEMMVAPRSSDPGP